MRRLNKRGMEDKLMFVIWELIVILMVVIVLEIAVKGIANNTTYWKRYHSADLALMSDLVIANQGDFIINYDIKDLQKNFVTNAMRIYPLKFQIFMKDGSFFIYDPSVDKDRFPQSFIFAKDRDVTILLYNTSNDYVTIYKKDKDVGMRIGVNTDAIQCPSEKTQGDLNTLRFGAIGLTDDTKDYGTYINDRLKTAGKGTNDEALIALTNSTTNSITIYYDDSSIKSNKLACFIQKEILKKFPDMNILTKPYDNSADIEPFVSQKNNYVYWIIINLNTSTISNNDLGFSITTAIGEFYG